MPYDFYVDDDRNQRGCAPKVVSHNHNTLYKDTSLEGINILIYMLRKAKLGQLHLSNDLRLGEVGYWWNIYTDEDDLGCNIVEDYWLWSTRYVQTWFYTVNDEVIIEISPSYPWHFLEPESNESYHTFKAFITTYRNIETIRIKISEIDQVINVLGDLLDRMKD